MPVIHRLTRSSVLERISELPALPVSWYVKRKKDQKFYALDLRTCQIVLLSDQVAHYFDSSSASYTPVSNLKPGEHVDPATSSELAEDDPLQNPELILKLDISLNGIEYLSIQDMVMFSEIRSLDASLNTIKSFEGIGASTKLVSLNLSYNNIQVIPWEALVECVNLQYLDLSVNKIGTLVGFPLLPNLINLQLRSNKLKSVQGLQALRSVKQINLQKNKITSIVHLCACLEITELNIADNSLSTVSDIIAAIAPLQRLNQLKLKGNPILEKVPLQEVQSLIVRESAVVLMDGINIRPMKSQFHSFSHHQPPTPKDEIKIELKEAIRESMKEGVERKREKTHERVYFLQKKMRLLLDELEDYENSSVTDTEAWCRYVDTLTREEARSLTVSQIRAAAIAEADGYVAREKSGYKVQRQHNSSSRPDVLLSAVADALARQSI